MIRINLLTRSEAPRFSCRAWRKSLVAGVGLVVLLLGWGWMTLHARYLRLAEEHHTKRVALETLEHRIGGLDRLAEERDRLSREYEALTREYEALTEERSLHNPAWLMAAISREMEGLDLWLVRLSLENGNLDVEGQALGSDAVRQFVDRLDRSSAMVSLREFTVSPVQDHQGERYRFVLHLAISGKGYGESTVR